MNRIALTIALAAGISCAAFGYEPQRHNDTFTTNGITYAQRGGLGASDYVVTNIDASSVGKVKSVNGQTGDVTLGAGDVGAIAKSGDTMSGVLVMSNVLVFSTSPSGGAQFNNNSLYALDSNGQVTRVIPYNEIFRTGDLPTNISYFTNDAGYVLRNGSSDITISKSNPTITLRPPSGLLGGRVTEYGNGYITSGVGGRDKTYYFPEDGGMLATTNVVLGNAGDQVLNGTLSVGNGMNGRFEVWGMVPDMEYLLRVGNSNSSRWVGLSRESVMFNDYESRYDYSFPHKSGTFALTNDIPSTMAWSAITSKPSWLGDTKPSYTASEVGAASPAAVSNIVTTAYVREKLGVYLYVGEDGGIYVHTNEE